MRKVSSRSVCGLVLLVGLSGCAREERKSEESGELARSVDALGVAASSIVVGSQLDGKYELFAAGTNDQGLPIVEEITPYLNGSQVALGDLNGDGMDEVIIGRGGGFRAYSQIGVPQINPPQYSLGPSWLSGDVLATGDFNNDGVDELVFGSHAFGDFVYVVPSTPQTEIGQLQLPTVQTFPPGSKIVACDLNNDGRDEFILSSHYEIFEVQFVQSTTSPVTKLEIVPTLASFFSNGRPYSFLAGHDSLGCGDLNNDGFDDLVVAHDEHSTAFERFEIFTDPSLPPITFFDPLNLPPFFEGEQLAVGDVDGDGFAEIGIGGVRTTGGGNVRVYSGPGKTAPVMFAGQPTRQVSGQGSFTIGRRKSNAGTDTDGDGLPDVWEEKGIDIDGDGCVDYDVKAQLADPFRKDLFVEIDAMGCSVPGGDCAPGDAHGHMPTLDAMGLGPVITAFDQSPAKNAMGRPDGIALHVILDETIAHTNQVSLDDSRGIQRTFFGSAAERAQTASVRLDGTTACTTTPAAVLKAKAQFYRYALWGHQKDDGTTGGVTPGRDVVTEPLQPEHRFLVTLFESATSPNGDPIDRQVAFMHELGHTLGLHHGGKDRFNWKPNYLSIMNYQFPGLPLVNGGIKLDYSRSELVTLHERGGPQTCFGGQCFDALWEFTGVGGGDPNLWTMYRCSNGDWAGRSSVGSFDWNCNVGLKAPIRTYPFLSFLLSPGSDTEIGVESDINGDRYCVDANPASGVLTSTPAGDDFRMGGYIAAGPNQVLESATASLGRQGDDVVMVVPPLPVPTIPHPSQVLLAGPDDVLQTVVPAGVDDFVHYRVTPGPNGMVDAVAAGGDVILFDESFTRTFLTNIYGPTVVARLVADGTPLAPFLYAGPAVNSNLGDDQLVPVMIVPGANGTLQSETASTGLQGDDVVGVTGAASEPSVLPGPDGILQTVSVSDEAIRGMRIVDGPNRECQTSASGFDKIADEDGNRWTFRNPGSHQQTVLTGYDDWQNLRFKFRATGPLGFTVGGEPTLVEMRERRLQASFADLSIAVTASAQSLSADGSVTYHVTLTNDGPLPAHAVQIAGSLPAPMVAAGCSTSAGGSCSSSSASFSTIAPSTSVYFDLTAKIGCSAAIGATLQIAFQATAQSADPDPSDNAASVTTTVARTQPVFTFVPRTAVTTQCTGVNIGTPIAQDACGAVTTTSNAPVRYDLGRTLVTWTATNAAGGTATATQYVDARLGDDDSCCPVGSNKIVGTSNNDTLNGTTGVDCILGRGAQDTINGNGGNDAISGGDGDDTINGNDGNDKLYGGGGQDTISGGNHDDLINGGRGDDICFGGSGVDELSGDQGQDRLNGDDGNDRLFGEQGTDILSGGSGDDYLEGGVSGTTGGTSDQCTGGSGSNTFVSCPNRPDAPTAPNACQDSLASGLETALDCGGSGCFPCAGGSACVAGSDCLSGVCSSGVCTTSNTALWAALTITSDWGSGYCATLHVSNRGASATSDWSVRIDTNQSTISSSWAGSFSPTSGNVLVTPASNQRVIAPGATNGAVGFCANRSTPATTLPFIVNRG